MKELVSKLTKVTNKFRQEHGREPTLEDYSKTLRLSVEKVKSVLKIMQDPISLSTPIGEDEDSNLEDFIEDKSGPNPTTSAVDFLRKQEVADVLATLSEREAKIISLRFGIDSGYPRTLEEVGKMFNVTRERVRQIEAKAIRKLRQPQPHQNAERLPGIAKPPAWQGVLFWAKFLRGKLRPAQIPAGHFLYFGVQHLPVRFLLQLSG